MGLALPVPVLIEGEDTAADGFGNRIAGAISAPRWQRVSMSSWAISPPFCRCSGWRGSGPPSRLQARMREDETENLGQAVADGLEVCLK